jgi:hypothetical protein
MRVIGQFRDLDNPDRFVWLRGFRDMAGRAPALVAFYGGSVWRAHRDTANATIIDSDNVLLLRPAWPGAGLVSGERQGVDLDTSPVGFIDATVFHWREPASPALLQFGKEVMTPTLRRGGAQALGCFARSGTWARNVEPTLTRWLARPATRLRLAPTSRSAIHA